MLREVARGPGAARYWQLMQRYARPARLQDAPPGSYWQGVGLWELRRAALANQALLQRAARFLTTPRPVMLGMTAAGDPGLGRARAVSGDRRQSVDALIIRREVILANQAALRCVGHAV